MLGRVGNIEWHLEASVIDLISAYATDMIKQRKV